MVTDDRRILSASALRDFGKWLAVHNPGQFGRLVADFLYTLAEVDPDASEYVLAVIVSRELRALSLAMMLDETETALASADISRVQERLGLIKAWLRGIETAASQEKLDLLETKEREARLANMASPSAFAM